jgi:hypothetical protein
MSSQTAMSLLSVTEFALWSVLTFLFWRKKLSRRFPAMGAYLALRVISTPVLGGVMWIASQPWGRNYYVVYFFGFWAAYIASAVLLFLICMEVFRSALSAFSGLMKFGTVVFRWAAVASVLVSFSTVSFSHLSILATADIAYGLMRSVSILELCLLAFLCLSMNALRLPVRDLAFGISLGFGVMSTNDFVQSIVVSKFTSLTAPEQFIYESVILLALGTWVVYYALPEPVRKPLVMPVNSTIYRWNEIASALGHTGTQVAVQQPANSFFLTDVERVVEKVLNRNLKGSESET